MRQLLHAAFVGLLFLLFTSGAMATAVQTQAARGAAVKAFSTTFTANTTAGNLIMVGFDYDQSAASNSIHDTQGNVFTEIGPQLLTPGGAKSRVFYANNIKGGADTVTIALSAVSPYLEIYITEYSGLDSVSPIDGQTNTVGTAGAITTPGINTRLAGDTLYGYCVGDVDCIVGNGFVAESILDGNLVEDALEQAPGTYTATASATSGWSMQVVALAAKHGVPAITSGSTAAATVGSAFSYQITASNTPTSFSTSGLPVGLTLNQATGFITGTPLTAGTYVITVDATNSNGTGIGALTLTVSLPITSSQELVVASGTATVPAASLTTTQCALYQIPVAAALPSMTFDFYVQGDLTTVQGFIPSSTGTATFWPTFITPGQLNIKWCNETITSPLATGAFPITWKVTQP